MLLAVHPERSAVKAHLVLQHKKQFHSIDYANCSEEDYTEISVAKLGRM